MRTVPPRARPRCATAGYGPGAACRARGPQPLVVNADGQALSGSRPRLAGRALILGDRGGKCPSLCVGNESKGDSDTSHPRKRMRRRVADRAAVRRAEEQRRRRGCLRRHGATLAPSRDRRRRPALVLGRASRRRRLRCRSARRREASARVLGWRSRRHPGTAARRLAVISSGAGTRHAHAAARRLGRRDPSRRPCLPTRRTRRPGCGSRRSGWRAPRRPRAAWSGPTARRC